VTLLEEAVVHRDFRAVLGDDLGAHGGEVTFCALAAVDDLLSPVQLDLGDVGALEKIGEEAHELRTLRLRQGVPVAAEERRAISLKSKISSAISRTACRRSRALPSPLRAGFSSVLTTRSMAPLS